MPALQAGVPGVLQGRMSSSNMSSWPGTKMLSTTVRWQLTVRELHMLKFVETMRLVYSTEGCDRSDDLMPDSRNVTGGWWYSVLD